MDDEAGGETEHLAGEREVLRPVLPERWDALLDHRVPEQPGDEPAVALEGVQVGIPVAAGERDTRDEVVEDEVVEDDDARRAAQRVDDPAVGLWVVADVVHREVRPARRPSSRRASP